MREHKDLSIGSSGDRIIFESIQTKAWRLFLETCSEWFGEGPIDR